jgi:hypothetical protein
MRQDIERRDTEGEERFRQALERIHHAQLETVERRGPVYDDAYEALDGLLESVGTIGGLLARLEWAEGEVAATRRRLVHVAVEAGTRVAQVLALALDMGERPGCRGLHECDEAGDLSAIPPPTEVGDLRAVTDLHRLLVAQLQDLYGILRRVPNRATRRADSLWRDLLSHVASLLPAAAALDRRDLSESERRVLERRTAEAANCLAFLRSYPRIPSL